MICHHISSRLSQNVSKYLWFNFKKKKTTKDLIYYLFLWVKNSKDFHKYIFPDGMKNYVTLITRFQEFLFPIYASKLGFGT